MKRKSTFSEPRENCVEVDLTGQPDLVVVSDSKEPAGPVLRFTYDEWDAFLDGVRAGEFDRKVP
ncbi:MAG TPA: DUF397 domain-containing protein [Iamia sp.]|nr:DUF397 domain-containing protein [Iamia sp.]